MKNTISLELSKKLAPYLEWVETELYWDSHSLIKNEQWFWLTSDWEYKALNLEEAIDFLPIEFLYKDTKYFCLNIFRGLNKYFVISYEYTWVIKCEVEWKTFLEAIEKMLEYLLTKNLLWKS